MNEILRPLTNRAFPGDANGGYVELPGGLIMQWGVVPNIPANGSLDINYKKPFPTGALTVVIGTGALVPGKPAIAYNMVDASKARFHNTSTTVESGISTFLAIGY